MTGGAGGRARRPANGAATSSAVREDVGTATPRRGHPRHPLPDLLITRPFYSSLFFYFNLYLYMFFPALMFQ